MTTREAAQAIAVKLSGKILYATDNQAMVKCSGECERYITVTPENQQSLLDYYQAAELVAEQPSP